MKPTPRGTWAAPLERRDHAGLPQEADNPLVEYVARPTIRQPIQPSQLQSLADFSNESPQVHAPERTPNNATINKKVSRPIDVCQTTV